MSAKSYQYLSKIAFKVGAPDKNGGFSWERTDLAAAIKSAVK
jgi:hypothetical protein